MSLNPDVARGTSRRSSSHRVRVLGTQMQATRSSSGGGGGGGSSGTRLYLSNLDSGVTNRDIELLFSQVGELTSHLVHHYENGEPKGTADVVYVHQSDALAAKERYDNSPLDGKRLRIQIVRGVDEFLEPAIVPPIIFTSYDEHAGQRGISAGEGRYGSTVGRIKNSNEKIAKELDAALEKYRREAVNRR